MNTNLPKPDLVTLGVGDGSGQHFVHGEYDTIKLLQGKLLRLEKAESELGAAKESIKELILLAAKSPSMSSEEFLKIVDRAKALLGKQ